MESFLFVLTILGWAALGVVVGYLLLVALYVIVALVFLRRM